MDNGMLKDITRSVIVFVCALVVAGFSIGLIVGAIFTH